ncbi:hypothetical protein BD410DRAFT_811059 [Rickenella mellea]|uniref:non-specific serine/threonine protein kinase n=1 Tax=Rickenella mellea TaxID=50990 RepID=A0A4R5XF67_9AGAM|nr:hypothetical protein BD410DRAFT_811059 [Rickenella mellea]
MSDSSIPRRQPPSPLVFSPETVLAPLSNQSQSQKHGSGSNTVSMPFIKRHVTRRLKTAKQECDKELHRVTNAITSFFEERLREGDQERDRDYRDSRDFRDHVTDHDPRSARESLIFNPGDLRSALQLDDTNSDGGYDAEYEGSRHSRQRASLEDASSPTLTHWSSSPGIHTASVSSSPASLRRQNTLPKDRAPLPQTSSASSAPNTTPVESSPRRPPSTSTLPTAWSSSGPSSRRLSRSIHIPVRPVRSGQSSRSTSRSRSPLPPTAHNSFTESAPSTSPNRRASRILVDDPVDPIMTVLYEIIAVATDITEMSLAQLTAQPKVCSQLVQRVQNIGKAWDEHPDWHGRNWYVQVLLAVASLSRVVEWWEAEKQFWNFEDDDDELAEPFTFLLKPADEAAPTPSTISGVETDQRKLNTDEENRLRLHRPTSQGRRSRDEARKDIGLALTPQRETEPTRPHNKPLDKTESARVLATERLRLQAEKAQNHNIVMELSLDGDHLVWINYAWNIVVGTDPEEVVGTRLSALLAPADSFAFKEATERLLADDSHTIEARFKLRVEPETELAAPGIVYREMEGKGMLMIDQVDGQPSHTMWVIKPIGPPELDQSQNIVATAGEEFEGEADAPRGKFGDRNDSEPITPFPFSLPISTAVLLCRICERNIPDWFFEKHNETCNEEHKFEADIGECNESISELRNTIRDLRTAIERSSPVAVPEYRGVPILSPSSSSGSSSPLQIFRPPLVSKMQRMSVKKNQRRLLEQLEDILQVAFEISVPALKEEESKEPIERQRLLSPGSEGKIMQIRTWNKPTTDDPALTRLVSDAEILMRTKVDNIARMQNTIKYSEKVRQEWEEKVEQALLSYDQEAAEEDDDGDGDEDDGQTGDDHSSTTSEYAFTGDTQVDPAAISSEEPTPMASASPTPSSQLSEGRTTTHVQHVQPIPTSYHGQANLFSSRSSTPSSVSSPLALATPIVAYPEPEYIRMPSNLLDSNSKTIRTKKSAQNLEPKVTVTPPMSPSAACNANASTTAPRSRRLSTVNTLVSPTGAAGPLSPRIPSVAPSSRATPTSIKDFEIIKPISKGAFGSVFLAKKVVTGDYYAIKVLKKADMIAKNQITNVKAERMILMNQADSPFVAKLFFTFQSKDNLYLVMEYLNGGDCAALVKSLGCLPEEWTRNYIAEVVLGLEYLHQRGIVHRDLKPDNLLIDQHGHLKLTDFGLSRIGLLGRQTRDTQITVERMQRPRTRYSPSSRPPSIDSAYMSSPMLAVDNNLGGSYFTNHRTSSASQIATSPYISSGPSTDDISESSGSESLSGFFLRRSSKPGESPLQSFATELTNDLRSYSTQGPGTPPGEQKFVGTPDYLAPESILGISGDDVAVDWWALGVITYEFLYGFPPFHAETPEKVFENILSGHVEWHLDHEDCPDMTPEALDFMKRLMTTDPSRRLGAKGPNEVKAHPFFKGIDWEKVTVNEAAFIPQVTDPESTDYFDLRGATTQLFHDEDAITLPHDGRLAPDLQGRVTSSPVPIAGREQASSPGSDDFGSFSFKNLPVLKQANDDVIRKLRTDQMAPMVHTLSEPAVINHPHRRSVSQRIKKPPSVVTSMDKLTNSTNPPSPATSASSIASSPSRSSIPPLTPGSAGSHARKPSEFGALERFKLSHMEGGDVSRRNSMPSRLRTASVSSNGEGSLSDHWPPSLGHASGHFEGSTPPSSVGSHSIDLPKASDPSDRAVTCLLAEDNPITAKIIETLLTRLGCRCVVVADGSEAISVALGDISFDCILMDLHMPVVDGESAARYIKSTANKNANVPIIAVSAYSGQDTNFASNLFANTLAKPVQKSDLIAAMTQLGFKTSTHHDGGPSTTKVIAR